MIFSVAAKVPFCFGPGVAAQIGKKAKSFGWSKVIFVYDKGVKTAGITDIIEKSLSEAGVAWVGYDGVLPDPPETVVEEAAAFARDEQVDGVVATGGGSSMDVAKCVSILLTNPSPISRYFGGASVENPPKGSILVPTTAGTGSEVSDVAIVSNSVSGAKIGVKGEYSKAKLALIDPELTYGLPQHMTASTAMDAFSHGFEAFTGTGNNPVSDMYAEKTMKLVVDNLPLALADPRNVEARTALSFAATLGGLAFGDSMAHLGHNFGENIAAIAHIAHGVSCTLGVLSIIDYISDAVPERISYVGTLFGLDPIKARPASGIGREVESRYRAFVESCGIAPSWSGIGVKEDVLAPAAKLIAADPILLPAAPKRPSEEEALALLRRFY
jgi:alcohol dehydrogenase